MVSVTILIMRNRKKRKTAEALSSSSVEQHFALQQQIIVQQLESRVLKAILDLHRERINLLQTHARDAMSEVETLDALVRAPSSQFKLSKRELDERVKILDNFEQTGAKSVVYPRHADA